MFLNYIRGNKYNSPLDTRNYRLSAPHEINVVSHMIHYKNIKYHHLFDVLKLHNFGRLTQLLINVLYY